MMPPFRAEHVGSLLRPMSLLALRRRFANGEVDQATLTAAEDNAIAEAIRLQQRVAGMKLFKSSARPLSSTDRAAAA